MNLPPATPTSRASALTFGVLVAIAILVGVTPLLPSDQGLVDGVRAPRTLAAAHAAQYESEVLTEAARERAVADVLPVTLPPDPAVRDLQRAAMQEFFQQVRAIRQRSGLSAQDQINELAAVAGAESLSASSRSNLLALSSQAFTDLEATSLAGLDAILTTGVAAPIDSATGETTTLAATEAVAARVDSYLSTPGASPASPVERAVLVEILNSFIKPNVAIDTEATDELREEARLNVLPAVVSFAEGQVIVREGQVLTAENVEALRETGLLDDGFDFEDLTGGLLFALLMGSIAGFGVHRMRPFAPPAGRRALVAAASIAGAMIVVRVFFPLSDAGSEERFLAFALPLATAAIITSALGNLPFGVLVAAVVGMAGAYCAATIPEIAGSDFTSSLESLELAIVFTAAGVAGAFAVQQAERIGRFALCAGVVALATGVPLLAFWLLEVNRDTADLPWIGLAAGLSGVGSAVLGAGLFIIVPSVFGIPTRLQLFELADTGHQLLRRLREEAPGTYHHSMMVGALAERAADTIGADALLAKVGAYYHDTGKLSSPGSYIENMLDNAPSPHDSMTPLESAAVIKNHVDAGIEIARKYRLPPSVRAFIPEHHGTRLVTFFYRKAVADGGAVEVEPYKYHGPRPQTRETAIVMLADSCEALARSKPSRDTESLSQLVDSVFAERLAEGQLDECDITMRELQAVARSFKDTLRAVYHPRIEYPQPTPEELIAMATGGS